MVTCRVTVFGRIGILLRALNIYKQQEQTCHAHGNTRVGDDAAADSDRGD